MSGAEVGGGGARARSQPLSELPVVRILMISFEKPFKLEKGANQDPYPYITIYDMSWRLNSSVVGGQCVGRGHGRGTSHYLSFQSYAY